MDFQVVFSKSALVELEEILAFNSQDEHAARKFYQKLRRNALGLGTFPKRHPVVHGRSNIRKFHVRPFTVYYRINEAKRRVTILHFWHGARQPPPL